VRILVDTSVWSLALRRRAADLNPKESRLTAELEELVREARVRMIGPIRQELLSGVREEGQYMRLQNSLRAFRDQRLETEDYEDAARLSNRCRAAGLAGSGIDFLICAAALRREWAIFTTDSDFQAYAKMIAIRLHAPRPSRASR
jgi:predicted nucleic acid-binding protein